MPMFYFQQHENLAPLSTAKSLIVSSESVLTPQVGKSGNHFLEPPPSQGERAHTVLHSPALQLSSFKM